mgnify:CR=1 FL=1|tara:strand:- start:208 stop:378 length:171 start_codon:yes stop_codon:yes gene_type:complete
MLREVYNQVVNTLKKYADEQVNLKSEYSTQQIAGEIVDDLSVNFMFIERETKKEIK